MSILGTTHDALRALWAADTGTGGLANTAETNNAQVRLWARKRDPNLDIQNGTGNWPYALTTVDATPIDSSNNRKFKVQFQIEVHLSRQDDWQTKVDAIATRMAATTATATSVFNDQTFASANGWYFAPVAQWDQREGPANGIEVVEVFVGTCLAST